MVARLLRGLGWCVMLLLALFVVSYAGFVLTTGAFPAPLRASFQMHHLAIAAHIAGGMVALAIAPFQLLPWLRGRRIAVHRWLGRAAMLGMLIGGLGGLAMAAVSYGGIASHLGFGAMALAWLATAGLGYRAIRARQVAVHRRWMVRNVAITLAVVTLRLWLPVLLGMRVPFDTAYPIVAWLCWVPNLLVAELLIQRGTRSRVPTPARPGPVVS